MSKVIYFITHPNVLISADVRIEKWPLSELGRDRMKASLKQPWVKEITAIYCSTEQKAIDGADILATHLALPVHQRVELGENDRSSTGFLQPDEFERVADEFFAKPELSVRGWERAIDAQKRIITAIESIAATDRASGPIAIVAHGAVGALLYCALTENFISRNFGQPENGGGNYFAFSINPHRAHFNWRAIDEC